MAVSLKHLVPKPDARAQAAQAQRRARREERQQAMGEARRGLILDAARSVFTESGLEGASLREIARRAGYTPGALYSYFDSKEAIYAELLGESIGRLQAAVQAARPAAVARAAAAAGAKGGGTGGGAGGTGGAGGGPGAGGVAGTGGAAGPAATALPPAARLLVARARAWFGFYARHPRDLDLGFYLAQGLGPKGRTAELNQRLNQRLLEALQPCEDALQALGCAPDDARREHAALFAHGVGLLLLQHTGRIRLFGQQADALFDAHLQQLLQRLCGGTLPGTASGGALGAAQPTLF